MLQRIHISVLVGLALHDLTRYYGRLHKKPYGREALLVNIRNSSPKGKRINTNWWLFAGSTTNFNQIYKYER